MTRRTGIVLLSFLLAIVAAHLWIRAPQSPAPSALRESVVTALQTELDPDTAVSFDFEQSSGAWAFICGTVARADGTDISTSYPDFESPDFCALLDITGPPEIRELDIGSTDMPAMDWMDKYELPDALFTEQ